MSDDSILELQYKAAELELSNSQLSEALYLQQQRIDTLELQLKALVDHLKGDDNETAEVPIDIPPHY